MIFIRFSNGIISVIKTYNIFLVLFVFTTFNREFRLFGLDPRFLLVTLGIVLLIVYAVKSRSKDNVCEQRKKFSFQDLFIFYSLILISNLSWLWSPLEINQPQFVNLVILNTSNAIFAAVFILYRSKCNPQKVIKYSLISLTILSISIFWVYFGLELPSLLHESGAKTLSEGSSFVNLFGQNVRSAGFAEDANFASLFSVVGFALCFAYWKKGQLIQIFMAGVFILTFALAFSRTILIGFLIALLILLVRRLTTKSWKMWSYVIAICFAFVGLYLMSHLSILRELDSTLTRFIMWDIAYDLFLHNPLIGGGISSVRSAIDFVYSGQWYVQCHSAFWQMLSENGIFALGVIVIMIARRYSLFDRWWQVFIFSQFVSLCLTYEMAYQQVFVCMLVLLPLLSEKLKRDSKIPVNKTMRMVNSGCRNTHALQRSQSWRLSAALRDDTHS